MSKHAKQPCARSSRVLTENISVPLSSVQAWLIKTDLLRLSEEIKTRQRRKEWPEKSGKTIDSQSTEFKSSNESVLDLNVVSGSSSHQRFRVIFKKLVHITWLHDWIATRWMAQKLPFRTAPSEKIATLFNFSYCVSPIYPCCYRHVSKDAEKIIWWRNYMSWEAAGQHQHINCSNIVTWC